MTLMNDEQCDIFASYISSELKSLKTPYLQKKLKRKIQAAILEVSSEEDNMYINQVCIFHSCFLLFLLYQNGQKHLKIFSSLEKY